VGSIGENELSKLFRLMIGRQPTAEITENLGIVAAKRLLGSCPHYPSLARDRKR
jgi:hypothetical protein